MVTGGSAGIGRAICEALLGEGRNVINVDNVLPTWSHSRLMSLQADLSDADATREVAESVVHGANVVALVNNAGATRPGTVESQTVKDLDYVYGLTLRASMILTQVMAESLRACGQGRVVNMSSRAALGKTERIAYSAAKAALIGMTRSMAMEMGCDGVTVNAIAPGPIATELFRQSNPAGAPRTQKILDQIVVKRMGTPEDVARAAMFFLAPHNGFVTGQVLYVCGGVTLGFSPI